MPRVFALLLLSLCCRAQQRCPWLNAATAGGALGGPVTSTVTPASCEFVRRQGQAVSKLRIEVSKDYPAMRAQCGVDAVPLKAIGNEAVACGKEHDGRLEELVVGRVREKAFLVLISITGLPAAREAQREKTRQVAEQVAGFLF